jgi:hypothetical protein
MKKITLMLAGLGIAAAALPATAIAAAPQPSAPSFQRGAWQNINARQNQIEAKINQGIRSGALSRSEAVRLRAEFRQIERLEATYRRSRPGLTVAERLDLDRRFDRLERSIRVQKNDRDDRRGGHGRRY